MDDGFKHIFECESYAQLEESISNEIATSIENNKQLNPESERLLYNILISRIIGRKFQRPCVAENLTLSEYDQSIQDEQIIIAKHKTQRMSPASIIFNEQERFMLKYYRDFVRPAR